MSVKHTIVRTVSVESICQEIDDAISVDVMSRTEAMKFLSDMLIQIELRMGWVRDAIREEHDGHQDQR